MQESNEQKEGRTIPVIIAGRQKEPMKLDGQDYILTLFAKEGESPKVLSGIVQPLVEPIFNKEGSIDYTATSDAQKESKTEYFVKLFSSEESPGSSVMSGNIFSVDADVRDEKGYPKQTVTAYVDVFHANEKLIYSDLNMRVKSVKDAEVTWSLAEVTQVGSDVCNDFCGVKRKDRQAKVDQVNENVSEQPEQEIQANHFELPRSTPF